MRKLILTPAAIAKTIDRAIGDIQTPGLTLENNVGSKVWRYRRRVRRVGTTVKRTLGSYPAYSIHDARTWASKLNNQVERGVAPSPTTSPQHSSTVTKAHELYMLWHEGRPINDRLKPRTIKDKHDIFRCDIAPSIGQRHITSVSDYELAEMISRKGETSTTRANRLASELRCFFGWCSGIEGRRKDIGMFENPAHALKSKYFKEKPRDVWLDDAQLRTFLMSLAKHNQPDRRRALILLLLSGTRPSEVFKAHLREITPEGDWLIPGSRTKNSLPLTVYLGEWGKSILHCGGSDEWVIPSPRIDGPLTNGWSKVSDTINKDLEVRCTPHVLRHTASSHWAKLGHPESLIRRMLNHKPDKLTFTYINFGFEEQKKAIWLEWEEKLKTIVRELGCEDALFLKSHADA